MAYTVVKGDTLTKIAAANGMTLAELIKLNPQISNPDSISVGLKVNVAPAAEEDPKTPTPVAPKETAPGVLAGGQLIEVPVGDRSVPNHFYVVYEFPPKSGKFISYQFDDYKAALAAVGTTAYSKRVVKTQSWFDSSVTAEAAAEEVVGLKGTWQGLYTEIMKDEANLAGVSDPTIIGKMLSDPEMQNIMVNAAIGDWSDEQIKAAQRKTSFWTEELYPGIDNFYGSSSEPEQAYNNYVRSVEASLKELGYPPDAAGSYKGTIEGMLDKKIDDQIFNSFVPTLVKANQNPEFYNALAARTQVELGKTLSYAEYFDMLSGEAAPELAKVAEGAVIAYQAKQASVAIDEGMIQKLIEQTDTNEQEAAQIFSEFNQSILGLGEMGLSRGNLTRDEVLSVAAGLNPETGRSQDEVRNLVGKLAREEGLFDDEKINFYVGYNKQGQPQRGGLASLTPEGA